MAIEKLHPFHALKSGSQVWFIPEKNISGWTRFLDWHINFLIALSNDRCNQKTRRDLSGTLKGILTEEDIHFDINLKTQYEQTLLSTQNYLPNTSTVMIRNFQDIKSWTDQIMLGLKQLKPRTARIFLPKGVDVNQFMKIMKDDFEELQVTVVEDVSPTHT
ncbi:MAG: hypothetical protein V4596_10655 [Bdellovibrionota bacterium]